MTTKKQRPTLYCTVELYVPKTTMSCVHVIRGSSNTHVRPSFMAPDGSWRGLAVLLLQSAVAQAAGPVFFDMKHSNNAARIRLWRALKEGMQDEIERKV